MNNNIVLISELSTFNNPFARKNKATLGGHVKKGAKIGAGIGGVKGAVEGAAALQAWKKMANVKTPKYLDAGIIAGSAIRSSAVNAVRGALAGAGVYGGKKVLKKTR